MRFLIAFALIAAVASAAVRPTPAGAELAELQEIIAAIQSPSTDPATAAALEEMLLDVLGVKPEPVAVGPAIVEAGSEPISVGPALIDFPMPDGGVIAEESIVAPAPAVVAPAPAAASTPLVQIILNINQAAAEASPIAVGPAVIPEPIQPTPVNVVDSAAEPVQVVEVAPVPAEPVQVVEAAPVPVEPVVIGTPVLPEAAVVLPEELN
ncbi:KH domain-containing protein 3-like isoform X1 [Helicoverpa zea]|uniref:KH domain-containing protein 3-like isoform X1 n=1 Tax=Helicoverpa zea TaxID=7113 RepID=UPI001F580230|nr:KH domain-containing protein 3-like isoform X1 [Helicoverpa zea]